MKFNAVVGALDVAVGEVLKAIAQIPGVTGSEAVAQAKVFGKLELAAEALVADSLSWTAGGIRPPPRSKVPPGGFSAAGTPGSGRFRQCGRFARAVHHATSNPVPGPNNRRHATRHPGTSACPSPTGRRSSPGRCPRCHRPRSRSHPLQRPASLTGTRDLPPPPPPVFFSFFLFFGASPSRQLPANKGWRALPPALARNSGGCFLPDLTRFTTVQCGEARRRRIVSIIARHGHLTWIPLESLQAHCLVLPFG